MMEIIIDKNIPHVSDAVRTRLAPVAFTLVAFCP
jgi:hypothetical protein